MCNFAFKIIDLRIILIRWLYIFDFQLREFFIIIIKAGNTNITVAVLAPEAKENKVMKVPCRVVGIILFLCNEP